MEESNKYVPKLVCLPGAKLSPEVLLHRTLNKLDCIKSVVVIIQWDDESFACDWSTMKISELCMAEKVLSLSVADDIRNKADG